jgi:hypothetical protein
MTELDNATREKTMSAMSALAADVQDLLEQGYTPAEIARVLNIEESLIDPRAFDTLYEGMDDYESDDGYDYVTGCDPAEDAYLDASWEDRFEVDFEY